MRLVRAEKAMTIPEIKTKLERASAGRLADLNPTATALLLALAMLEKIAVQLRHPDYIEQDWRGNPRKLLCTCPRCLTTREVDATLAAIQKEFE